jgi:hypothetical protein
MQIGNEKRVIVRHIESARDVGLEFDPIEPQAHRAAIRQSLPPR